MVTSALVRGRALCRLDGLEISRVREEGVGPGLLFSFLSQFMVLAGCCWLGGVGWVGGWGWGG